MTDTQSARVRVRDSVAVQRAEQLQRAFRQRFPFAMTGFIKEDEDRRCPTLFAAVPPSYFEFRDPWLGYVVFARMGILVVVTEIRPDYSYREVQTRLGYYEPDFELRVLEIFQEVIDRG